MKAHQLGLVLLVVGAACSGDDVQLRGTLGEGWPAEPLYVSVVGGPPALPVREGAFEVADVAAGPIGLRFADSEGGRARMEIRGLAGDASLSLDRIRMQPDRGLAFPSSVGLEGTDLVTINGVRFSAPGTLPERIEQPGTVLALSADAGVMLVRPGDERLPDLRVVVTRATRVVGRDGDSRSFRDVAAGDPVRVEGRPDLGYVYARRIVLPGAEREEAAEEGASDSRSGTTDAPQPPPGATERRGAGKAEDGAKHAKPGKERERESKGRGGRGDIPKGHRPPPGECRDWNPNLPPGQQPPPRKC